MPVILFKRFIQVLIGIIIYRIASRTLNKAENEIQNVIRNAQEIRLYRCNTCKKTFDEDFIDGTDFYISNACSGCGEIGTLKQIKIGKQFYDRVNQRFKHK